MSLIGNFFGNIGYYNHMRSFPAKAEKYYQRGMRFGGMSPKNEGAYGVLLLKQGKFEEALERFNSALSSRACKKQLKPLIGMNRAITWFRLGQVDRAVAALEGLHKSFRGIRVYQTLGYVYTAAGMFDKAEPYNLEACEYEPDDAVIQDNTGQMYLEMGQIDKARGYFERAYAKKRISDVLYHMGLVAEHDGRPEDALAHYREAMAKNMDALNDVTPAKLRERINALREQLGITEEEEEI
jgi:tetratricopeptide (TPR) repeat protein